MTRLAASLLLLAAAPAAAGPALLFPAGGRPAGLGLDPAAGGPAPEVAWAAFLDRLHAHFDRDGDGALVPAEYGRVFALPDADGRALKPAFAALDADRDGKVSPAEFRAGWRAAGFAPVVVAVRPAPAESLRLGHALFAHLDRDDDGALSAAELRAAPALLRRLDEDEDEVLTAAELLATAPAGTLPPAGLTTGDAPSAPSLRLGPGGKAALAGADPAFRLSADGTRLTVPGGVCVLAAPAADPAVAVRTARGFYAAQFQAAAGDGPAGKAAVADDPALRVLAELFDPADRDGDGRLTRAELDAFFELIEAGAACRVVVTVSDRGRNLFDVFDRDGDGRLDLAELTRAGRELPAGLVAGGPLTPAAVPASYRLAAGRGTTGAAFGPVPLAAPAARPAARPAPAAGPRWFVAMDRNLDGYVSAAEFTGPPRLFAELDRDGDGRLSPAEAASAGR